MDETDWDDSNDETFKALKHSSITDIRKDIDLDIDLDAFIIGGPIKIKEEPVIKPQLQNTINEPQIKKNIHSKTQILVNNIKKAGSQKMFKCYYCNRDTRSNNHNELDNQILCSRCEKFEY